MRIIGRVILLICGFAVSLAVPTVAKADLFLHLDGVTGRSTDPAHLNWIDAKSFAWTVNDPYVPGPGSRPYSDFFWTQGLDGTVAALHKALVENHDFPTVVLDFTAPPELGGVVYFEMTFTWANLAGEHWGGGFLQEYEMSFAGVTLDYWKLHPDGMHGQHISASYDPDLASTHALAEVYALGLAGPSIESGGSIPEPRTLGLLATALVGFGTIRRRKMSA
jgi:type VI protein secretion system component Hcp